MKKWIVWILLVVVSTLLLIIISTATSIYTYGNQQKEIKADVAIVLGAAVWGNQPSPVFRERINHAIKLYQNGNVSTIIFTGGIGENDKIAEATVGKQYALKMV